MYQVAERFVSINGEGTRAGELAAFIRFKGCNLRCSYCDTAWANTSNAPFTLQSAKQLCSWVLDSGVKNVTLTGGEPLLQSGIEELIDALAVQGNRVEIETNGSVNLRQFALLSHRPVFTMDYKLPSSGMERLMLTENFGHLCEYDSVKFVAGSVSDLEKAKEIICKYLKDFEGNIFFSPVFGRLEPERIVKFMTDNRLTMTRLQLQLHKFIWDPDKRGV